MEQVAPMKSRRFRQLEDRIDSQLDTIETGWRSVAKDLAEIRDKSMHHEAGYDDWYQYVLDRWDGRITRNQIQHMVGAHDVVESISKGINDLDEDRVRSSRRALKNKDIPTKVFEPLRTKELDDTARAEIFSSAVRHAETQSRRPTQRDVKQFVDAHFPDREHAKTRQRVRRLVEELIDVSRELTPAQLVKSMRAGNGDPVVERVLRNGIPKVIRYLEKIQERIEQ